MFLDSKTRQRLLELVYEVLPEDEAAELWRQIETDSEMARAYADARRTAGLMAEAATVKAPRIERRRHEQSGAAADSLRSKATARAAQRRPTPWVRGTSLAVGLTAAVLLLASIVGLSWQRGQLRQLATENLRLLVTGPARFYSGAANHYSLLTTSVTGEPVAAQVELALNATNGKQLFLQNAWTDPSGRLELAIPADVHLPSRVALKISATCQGKTESLAMPLDVEPTRYATQLFLDKPHYRPGETVYYRSLTLSPFGLAAEREFPLQFEILDPGGNAIPGSSLSGMTTQGVGNGSFRLPENLAGGTYWLLCKSLDSSLPAERRAFVVQLPPLPGLKLQLEFARDRYAPGEAVVADFSAARSEGGPAAAAPLEITAVADGREFFRSSTKTSTSGTAKIRFKLPEKIENPADARLVLSLEQGRAHETIRRDLPLGLGLVDVAFRPEGGEMVAGLENRIYFTARDGRGRPVDVRGTIIGDHGNEILDIETSNPGMGVFTLSPNAGEHYRLKITSPTGIQKQPALPETLAEHGIVLTAGPGVFDAGQPLQLTVQSTHPNLPLVLAASCRGVPAGQLAFVTSASGNRLTLPLSGEVGGVMCLTLYDYRLTPPQPLAERFVYRRVNRRLQIHSGDGHTWYVPGERVKLALEVSNEKRQPVAANLGVSVVDEAVWNLANDGEPVRRLLTDTFDTPEAVGELTLPARLEDANFRLSEGSQAAVALDLLLGSRAWRPPAAPTSDPTLAAAGGNSPGSPSLGTAPAPAMFDNLSQIRAKYEESLRRYRTQRSGALDALTVVSFFGGFGLALLVAMMAMFNIIAGARIWVPALIAAIGCLIIGAILMNPYHVGPNRAENVAFEEFKLQVTADKAALSPKTGPAEREQKPQSRVSSSAAPLVSAAPAFPIQQYAYRHSTLPGRQGDSVETLAWYPTMATAADGRAQIDFEFPAAAATYRLRAEAHGGDRLGAAETEIRCRPPLAIQARLPEEVSVGDRINVPVAILNQTAQTLPANLAVEHGKQLEQVGNATPKLELRGQQSLQEFITFHAIGPQGECPIQFRAVSAPFSENSSRTLRIVAPGVPIERAYSGILERSSKVTVELPPQWEPGSLQVTLVALPTVLAELRQISDSSLRAPAFSLDQVIGANSINTLILQSLEAQGIVAPALLKQTKERLQTGLAQLAAAESPAGGLGPFPGQPADESLSAYGLMQLSQSGRVYNVDRSLAERIVAWLMRRRDGLGGFLPDDRTSNRPRPRDANCVDVCITWALAASGEKTITVELDRARRLGTDSNAPYLVALAALSLIEGGRADETAGLLDKLLHAQQTDGHLSAGDSILGGSGLPSEVETTALAALAWMGSPAHAAAAGQAMDWLAGKREGSGGFGTARATVLAIRAMSESAKRNPRPMATGNLRVSRDGRLFAEQPFTAEGHEPIVLGGLESKFTPGKNPVTLTLTGGGKMPYVLAIAYHLHQPAAHPPCPIHLLTALSQGRVKAGGSLTLSAEITNSASTAQPLTIAMIGIPAGLEVPPERLEQLRKAGTIDAYQIRRRQLVCGWRTIPPEGQIRLQLDLTAAIPGQYTGPPSCIYVYHAAEDTCWIDPLTVDIAHD